MKKGKIKNKSVVPAEDKVEEKAQEESGQLEAEELLEAPESEEQPEVTNEEEKAPESEEKEDSQEEKKEAPPKKKAPKGELLVRIKPGRGIGGYGQAGWEGSMPKELAEQYAADGYLEILEQ